MIKIVLAIQGVCEIYLFPNCVCVQHVLTALMTFVSTTQGVEQHGHLVPDGQSSPQP